MVKSHFIMKNSSGEKKLRFLGKREKNIAFCEKFGSVVHWDAEAAHQASAAHQRSYANVILY